MITRILRWWLELQIWWHKQDDYDHFMLPPEPDDHTDGWAGRQWWFSYQSAEGATLRKGEEMAELSHEHMWQRVGEGMYGTVYRCSRCGETETWTKTSPTPSTDEAREAVDEEDDDNDHH